MENLQAFMIGTIGGGKVDPAAFSLRITGTYVPAETAMHRSGFFSTGPSRLSVDGKWIADNWDSWTIGQTFFEEGCDEVTGEIALVAGRPVQVVFEYTTKKSENLVFTAFQVGIGRPSGDGEIAEAIAAAKRADLVVICAGRNGEWDTEGADLPHITLPGRQNELIEAVAAVHRHVIVAVQTGGPVEMPWLDKVSAVVQFWYPGQEAGNAFADVLFGSAEPGGRLPQTFPVRYADNPTYSQDPEIYPGHDGKVRYEEGLFVGYRHYDKSGTVPLFPFGFGLSYSTFEWGDVDVSSEGEDFVASVTVTNTGTRFGSEVVQIYVEDDDPLLPRPVRELKGFAKLHLQPGETATARIRLGNRAFAVFSPQYRGWIARAGEFKIIAAPNATAFSSTVTVRRLTEWRKKARRQGRAS